MSLELICGLILIVLITSAIIGGKKIDKVQELLRYIAKQYQEKERIEESRESWKRFTDKRKNENST